MTEPFLGEVRMFGFNYPPRGWALCDGSLLQINVNQALYSLLGTAYGGDGRSTFGIPDLRGRAPVHVGGSSGLGVKAGEEKHLLTIAETPSHDHDVFATASTADQVAPTANQLADSAPNEIYHAPADLVDLRSGTISTVGGQAHENMMPFLTVNFAIALQGLFPSRN